MRHTTEEMQGIIKEWQTSGLSKKAFCRHKQINYPTFQYWSRRLVDDELPGFTEVVMKPNAAVPEIVFPSGARMMLHSEPSAAWLRELLC